MLPHACPSAGRKFTGPLIVVALLLGPNLCCVAAAAPVANAPKTHVLFIGADLAVEQGKEYRPLADVTGSTLVLRAGEKTSEVPVRLNPNLQVTEKLKISATSVEIAKFQIERVYTPSADPFSKLTTGVTIAAGQSAVSDLAQGHLLNAQTFLGNDAVGQSAVAKAEAEVADANLEATRQIYDNAGHSTNFATEMGRELFDAIQASFEVIPEKTLDHPYYAVIAQFREPGSKPTEVRRWVYVKSLAAMDAGVPKKVRVYQGGFPPGFLLEKSEVHIYNEGQELATNASRKRVPLTDDEAFQFAVIEYVGLHKGATLPAVLARTHAERAQLEAIAPRLQATYFLRVTKQGRVADVFTDGTGQQKLADVDLGGRLAKLPFFPALEKGAPVEAFVPLAPGTVPP